MLPIVLKRRLRISKCCAFCSLLCTFYGIGLPLIMSGVCSLLIWSELLEFMVGSDRSPVHSTSEQMHGPVYETKNVVQWKKSVLKVSFLQTRQILHSLEPKVVRNEYNSTYSPDSASRDFHICEFFHSLFPNCCKVLSPRMCFEVVPLGFSGWKEVFSPPPFKKEMAHKSYQGHKMSHFW